ncbi:MAG: hypothetical protein IPK82_05790 [Polyangiaceae bacterium]|nr:hypothetical protein [Polyangiaceae bacterium]
MRGTRSHKWLCLAAFSAVIACGPSFDGAVYRGDGFAFRVPERPASWTQLSAEGAALAYRDDSSNATVAVNARCGKDSDDVPLAALTRHLFIQFTEREVTTEEVVPFDGREALHTVMTAKLDGVPKSFDVWVMKKDGCVFDLLLIAAPEKFPAAAAEFRKFVSGFATVRHDG